MTSPFISVVIPVYQAGSRVGRAARTALACPEVGEVLLVEDGSPDDSLVRCRELVAQSEGRARILQHPGGANRGAGATRNLGMRSARFDVIAFLDADDYYLPGRFQLESSMLHGQESIDGLHGAVQAEFESPAAQVRFEAVLGQHVTGVPVSVRPDRLLSVLAGCEPQVRGHIHLNALSVKRSAIDRIGYFDETLRLHQDSEWILRAAARTRLASGSPGVPVAVRVVHASNRITAQFDRNRSLFLFHSVVQSWCHAECLPLTVVRELDFQFLTVASRVDAPARRSRRVLHQGRWLTRFLASADPRARDVTLVSRLFAELVPVRRLVDPVRRLIDPVVRRIGRRPLRSGPRGGA